MAIPNLQKSVLIIEDEAMLLQALTDALTAEGFTVFGATNGQEGLMVAKSKHPDLILLDILMPKMDGLTMVKELRADPWGQNALVIILTNVNDYRSVAEALGQHVHDYLVKSDWAVGEVVDAVKKKLNLT